MLKKLYNFIFARPSMQKLNNKILNLAIHARGFNNHKSFQESGEANVIKLLNKLDKGFVLDIGANVGSYSKIILEKTHHNIIAFEPLSEAYSSLLALESKFSNRIITENFGIGDANSTSTIYYSKDALSHASFSKEVQEISYLQKDSKIEARLEIKTLDSYLLEKPLNLEIALLKIDVEGYEEEVLKGASDILMNHKPQMIQIEYNLHQLFKRQTLHSLHAFIKDYLIYQMLPYGLIRRDVNDPLSNFYAYSNFLFVRDDIVNEIER